jgi:FixJ family two-component response regulator
VLSLPIRTGVSGGRWVVLVEMRKDPNSVAIIDADASACLAMSRLLRAAGFAPSMFTSAETFLADERRAAFAALLLDIQLPGMSGLELQRRLLTEGDRTPVIFVTAQDDPAARAQAVQNGCAEFFRKVDPGAVIVDALRRAAGSSEIT